MPKGLHNVYYGILFRLAKCQVARSGLKRGHQSTSPSLFLALLALLLLLPATASAQDSPVQEKPAEVGMSDWAFKFALLGQVADIVSTETALAAGGVESNPIMRHRAVRISTKLAIPVLARWAYKKVGLPRAQSNANAVVMGGLGFGPAAWNVFITVKLANR